MKNRYIQIDSLSLLERLESNNFDLVFLDPPFGYDSEVIDKDKFSIDIYLDFTSKVLQQSCRVLKHTGVVVMNISPVFANETRSLLDGIFGRKNYQQEIVVPVRASLRNQKINKTEHHIFLCYSKSDAFKFSPPTRPYTKKEMMLKYPLEDNKGCYRLESLFTPVRGYSAAFVWNSFTPPKGSSWRYTKEKLNQLLEDDAIEIKENFKLPRFKRYFSEGTTIRLGNVWDDIDPLERGKERISGFTGQLSLELIERIIFAYTESGDLILDPFAGVASTTLSAINTGRKCLSSEASKEVALLAQERLINTDVEILDSENFLNTNLVVHNTYSLIKTSILEFENIIFYYERELSQEEDINVEFKVSVHALNSGLQRFIQR